MLSRIKIGQTYILVIKNNGYWASMNGKKVKVIEYPLSPQSGYKHPEDFAIVKLEDGSLPFIASIDSLKDIN